MALKMSRPLTKLTRTTRCSLTATLLARRSLRRERQKQQAVVKSRHKCSNRKAIGTLEVAGEGTQRLA